MSVLLALAIPSAATGQIPLLEALDSAPDPSKTEGAAESDVDPLLVIENTLAEARQRLSALKRARKDVDGQETSRPSVALELSARLVRVLEQRREAQIRTNDLDIGRTAIEAGLARDPSELFGVPPPFPVPILDGVLQSWRREVEQESAENKLDRHTRLRRIHETELAQLQLELATSIRKATDLVSETPNAAFLETNLINWTHQDPRMRLRFATTNTRIDLRS